MEEKQKTDQTYYCENCGELVDKKAKICLGCGCELNKHFKKSNTAAGLFALLLGGLGVHKFYMGKPFQGILYLLFCWTGIPSLIGLIEGILYLTKDNEEFNREYIN